MEFTRQFFDLSLERKLAVSRSPSHRRGFTDRELTKQRLDLKQVFDFGRGDEVTNEEEGENQWPYPPLPSNDEDSDYDEEDEEFGVKFKAAMETCFESCSALATKLLTLILCGGLDLNHNASRPLLETIASEQSHSSFMRLNYYPCPAPSSSPSLGISRHTDAGLLTVLTQDEVAGFEVYSGSKVYYY